MYFLYHIRDQTTTSNLAKVIQAFAQNGTPRSVS